MFWVGLLLLATLLLSFYVKQLFVCLLNLVLSDSLPVITQAKGPNSDVKRIQLMPTKLFVPFLEGLYTMYHFHKHGMNLITHYARTVPLEDINEVNVGPFKFLLTGNASVSSKILSSTDPGHLSRPKMINDFVPFLNEGLICTPYEIWIKQRKIASRAFSFHCIQSYMETIDLQSKRLVQDMKTIMAKNDGAINGQELQSCLDSTIFRIMLEFIMGSGTELSESVDAQHFARDFLEFRDIIYYRIFHLECYVPVIWWFHPRRMRENILNKRMFAFVEKVIDYFKSNSMPEVINENARRCLIGEMIKQGASAEEIYHETATFLAVGYDTMSGAISLLLHHLACQQEFQIQCRDEVDNLLGPDFDDDANQHLDLDKISRLEYLNRFISESMRIAPTTPFTVRDLNTPLKINESLTLREGQMLVTSPWLIHRNPKYYPQPEIFDPDRFLPEEIAKREPGTFIPFIAGNRNCIGKRVAMIQLKTFSAWILRNFQLTTPDGLHDVKLVFEGTNKPERPFQTTIKLRRNEINENGSSF